MSKQRQSRHTLAQASLLVCGLITGCLSSHFEPLPQQPTAGVGIGGSAGSGAAGTGAAGDAMPVAGTGVGGTGVVGMGCPDCGGTGAPSPTCGNGILEQGEACEPGVYTGVTCATLGEGAGMLSCNAMLCMFDTSGCYVAPPPGPDGGYDAGPPDAQVRAMTCIPGAACTLSGAGICSADGQSCVYCASTAQCVKAYGAGHQCAAGTCVLPLPGI